MPLEAGGLKLDVIDHGPGIPAGDPKAVFEPFYRTAVNHPRPGTGIGLALVAGSAALHGGEAWVQDTEAGTHIAVTLPERPPRITTQGAGPGASTTD